MAISSCAPRQRHGMVMDRETGLQYGSTVSHVFIVDPSLFVNRKVKIRIRNTYGDPAFNLHRFRAELERTYANSGYEPTRKDGFGLLLDVNITYSGQISRTMLEKLGLLGSSAGAITGFAKGGGIGAAGGGCHGRDPGRDCRQSHHEDTYIVNALVSLVILKRPPKKDGTTIVFSASREKKYRKRKAMRSFEQRLTNRVSVYAGGDNTPQVAIVGHVRQRFIRILSDII